MSWFMKSKYWSPLSARRHNISPWMQSKFRAHVDKSKALRIQNISSSTPQIANSVVLGSLISKTRSLSLWFTFAEQAWALPIFQCILSLSHLSPTTMTIFKHYWSRTLINMWILSHGISGFIYLKRKMYWERKVIT